jgi:hypothetical protein
VAVQVPADQSTRQERLLSYLKAAVPAVAAGWAGVKAKVKAMNDGVRAAKEAAVTAATAFEESLRTIEKVDLSGDGGVVKQVLSWLCVCAPWLEGWMCVQHTHMPMGGLGACVA